MKEGDVLTREQVAGMIGEGRIHTFVVSVIGLLGADTHDREDILRYADEGRTKRAGPRAIGLGHGIVVHRAPDDSNGTDLFVETNE